MSQPPLSNNPINSLKPADMSEHFSKISLWGKNKDRRDMGGGMFFRHPPYTLRQSA